MADVLSEPRVAAGRWEGLARFVTNFTSPPFLLVPTLVVLALFDRARLGASYSVALSLGLAVFWGVVAPVAMVVILQRLEKVSSLHIPIRQQRTLPFLLGILSYVIGTLLVGLTVGMSMVLALMFCYTFNTVLVLLINLGWKISVHLIGVGGPLAALTVVIGWWVLPLFVLFPLVGWTRLYLKAHTPWQVVGGAFFGYLLTLLQLLTLFRAAW